MTTLATAIRQLELVSALAEKLLQSSPDTTTYIETRVVGNSLALILSMRADEPADIEQRAMLELALWSRRYGNELDADRLASLVLGELVSLWIDQGMTRDDFLVAMASGWDSFAESRRELGLDEVDSSAAEPSRTH